MKKTRFFLFILIALCSAACTDVLPRQRGNLALPQMAYVIDAQEFALRQHIAVSKESAVGGYGGGGGGCGCN
ncbi:MAG: DUF4266 domain-containing protein [Gammaproteobacteria bacterium]